MILLVKSKEVSKWYSFENIKFLEGCIIIYLENIDEIKYEGRISTNPLVFKYYNSEEKVAGKTMEETLRFGIGECYDG